MSTLIQVSIFLINKSFDPYFEYKDILNTRQNESIVNPVYIYTIYKHITGTIIVFEVLPFRLTYFQT